MSADADLAQAFREAMSRLAAGVVVVTNWHDDRPWGLTVSACCSVSASPPTLLICLGSATVSAKGIAADGRFGVSLLRDDKRDIARTTSKRGVEKFIEGHCLDEGQASPFGAPVLDDGLAHLDCQVARTLTHGDHAIIIGEVQAVLLWPEGEPLLYFSRNFRELGQQEGRGPAPVWWGFEALLDHSPRRESHRGR